MENIPEYKFFVAKVHELWDSGLKSLDKAKDKAALSFGFQNFAELKSAAKLTKKW